MDNSSPIPPAPSRQALIVLAVGCAGAAATIYETCWDKLMRTANTAGGPTTYTILIGVAIGLMLGSQLSSRVRPRSAGIAFASTQFFLGLCGLVAPRVIHAVGEILVDSSFGGAFGSSTLKFTVWCALLVVPGVLMGAALPLATRLHGGDRPRPILGWSVAWLCAAYGCGEVLGGITAGFWLMEQLGLAMTSAAGSLLNICATILLLGGELWSLLESSSDDRDLTVCGETSPAESAGIPGGLAFALLFMVGFSSVGYQLLYARVLPLVAGGSWYSFSLLLVIWAGAIALGSLTYGLMVHFRGAWDLAASFGVCAAGLWVLCTLPFFSYLPQFFLLLRSFCGVDFAGYKQSLIVLGGVVCFCPAFFIGFVFPAVVDRNSGGSVTSPLGAGACFAAVALGRIVGAVATGWFFIPVLGSPFYLQLLGIWNLLIATLALDPERRRRIPAHRIAIATLLLACIVFPPASRRWLDLLAGNSFSRLRTTDWQQINATVQRASGDRVEQLHEDLTGVAAITQVFNHLTLTVNGKVEASTGPDMVSQILLAELPLLAHPSPKRVFVLGLGSGVTAGSTLLHAVDSVDCAEICQGVAAGSELFRQVNGEPGKDRRFHLLVGDGRQYLRASTRPYDVIILGPTHPWVSGASVVYSREFLEICRTHLAPGGLVLQWCPLYEIGEGALTLITNTFSDAFPAVRAFREDAGGSLMLLGAGSPNALEPSVLARRMADRMQNKSVKKTLASVGFGTAFTLFCTETAAAERRPEGSVRGPILSDDQPVLEFAAPIDFYQGNSVRLEEKPLPKGRLLLHSFLGSRQPNVDELEDFALYRMNRRNYVGLSRLLTSPDSPSDVRLWRLAVKALIDSGSILEGLSLARQARSRYPKDEGCARLYYDVARVVESSDVWSWKPVARPQATEAVSWLLQLLPRDPKILEWAFDEALARSDLAVARRTLEQLTAVMPADPGTAIRLDANLWLRLASQYHQAGQIEPALQACREALRISPACDAARSLIQELEAAGKAAGR